ncbi:hypothetical protein E4U21_000185 [Claviceps maximensis]|nr:hypothetical protein E4U21_000185 [Claviceps maximensis]
MRGPISLVAVLSALFAAGAALPQIKALPRAADGAPKRKYSVVPLEPGDDGRGGSKTSGAQTVVETIVKTEGPVTKYVTKTGSPVTVTESAPTGVPVVPIISNTNTYATVTITVHVTAQPTSMGGLVSSITTISAATTSNVTVSASTMTTRPTTTVTPPVSDLSTSWHVPHGNSTTSLHCTEGTSTSSASISLTTSTTITTPSAHGPSREHSSSMALTTTTTSSTLPVTPSVVLSTSTRTYDDGMWHTAYPHWNESAPHA